MAKARKKPNTRRADQQRNVPGKRAEVSVTRAGRRHAPVRNARSRATAAMAPRSRPR